MSGNHSCGLFHGRPLLFSIMKGAVSCYWVHLLVFSLSFSTLATSVCYFPNEHSTEFDSVYQPCSFSNDGVSMCCALSRDNPPGGNSSDGLTRDTCLQNGLCMNSQNAGDATTYWRDLCTSTDWSDKGKCLNVCVDIDTGDTQQLTPCDGTATSTTWCCGFNNTDCCNTTSAVTIPAVFGATSSFTPTAIPIANQTSYTSGSSGLSTGAKAGIGVGAGVGALLAISAFAALFLRARKNKRLEDNSQYTLAATADTSAYEVRHRGPQSELESNTIHEASAGGHELKHDLDHSPMYELPGEPTGVGGK